MSNTIISSLCKIRYLNLHVRGNNIQASASYECGWLSATVYCNKYNQVLYTYAYMIPDTYHQIEGQLSMSAYNNRNSRKAVYSANITLADTHALNISTTSSTTPPDINTISGNELCEFVVKCITLQNWNTPLVKNSRGNFQDLAKNVANMYHDLMAKGVLGQTFACPVIEVEETHSISTTLRPSVTSFKSTQYELNPAFLVFSGAAWVEMLFEQQQQQQQPQQPQQQQQQDEPIADLPFDKMQS